MKRNYVIWAFIIILILILLGAFVVWKISRQSQTASQYIFPPAKEISPLDFFFDLTPFITVDYAKQTATGSPYIFGGVHSPDLDQPDAWDQIAEVGVTVLRRDFFLEYEVPANITLSDYKNNVNDVQNPAKWNRTTGWTNITITNQIYENAQKRGMKVMGILSYVPAWLTYSGTNKGVPKDWDIYEDIVKKVYRLHRPYIDYLEIWNEPTYPHFLDIAGSNLSRESAYNQIYYHAVKAIKEVELEMHDGKEILIGAQIGYEPTSTTMLEYLLADSRIRDNLDFVSYHNYEHISEPSWNNYRSILDTYKKLQIPIYITEWNYASYTHTSADYRYGSEALTYTASKLVTYLKMGLPMVNYYALKANNRPKSPDDDPSYSFYTWINGKAELLPQGKTWRLLSVSLGLGKGKSQVFDTQEYGVTAAGFENTFKISGLAAVNSTDTEKTVKVELKHLKKHNFWQRSYAQVYLASNDFDGGKVIEEVPLTKIGDQVKFNLRLPSQSVIGIRIVEKNILDYMIR